RQRPSMWVIAVALALVLARPVASQQGAVAGRVIDATTLEPRAGAAVSIVGTTRGVLADTGGRFVIGAIDGGNITDRSRMLGYKTLERVVTVRAGETTSVELRLETEARVLGAVRTQARAVERDQFETRPNVGSVSVTGRAAATVPAFGERDIIR